MITLALVNGHVWTGNASQPEAEAVITRVATELLRECEHQHRLCEIRTDPHS